MEHVELLNKIEIELENSNLKFESNKLQGRTKNVEKVKWRKL